MINYAQRAVGYISAESLQQLEQQWAELIEAGVDVILIDRHFLTLHFNQAPPSPLAGEAEAMWRYIESMQVGQDICGNSDGYQELEDIQAFDTVVVTELAILRTATPDAWERLNVLFQNGTHLAELSTGFNSSGKFGTEVLRMLNETYALGLQRAATLRTESTRATAPRPIDAKALVTAARMYLDDESGERFELHKCSEAPEGWPLPFDPIGWVFFAVMDPTEGRLGATWHIAVNTSTLEVRDIGFFGE